MGLLHFLQESSLGHNTRPGSAITDASLTGEDHACSSCRVGVAVGRQGPVGVALPHGYVVPSVVAAQQGPKTRHAEERNLSFNYTAFRVWK